MQFKLGKHMQPADMMRQEGERAARKSQRRNAHRELKNLGKSSDEYLRRLNAMGNVRNMSLEERKKVPIVHNEKSYKKWTNSAYIDPTGHDEGGHFHPEYFEDSKKKGRGSGPGFHTALGAKRYNNRMDKIWEKAKASGALSEENLAKSRKYMDAEWKKKHAAWEKAEKEGKTYHPPAGYSKDSAKEDAEFGEGRGGYSYSDIHKTPLTKLVAARHPKPKKKYDPEEEDAKGEMRWESWAEDHPEEAEKMMEEGRGGGKLPQMAKEMNAKHKRFPHTNVTFSEFKHHDDPLLKVSHAKSGKERNEEQGRGGTPPAGHHSQDYWKKWASGEHKADTAAKNEYSQGENAIERKIPSETTPGKEYRVWGDKGNMHCSCPSFTYRNTCKHVQSLGEEGPKRKMKYGRNYYYSK